MKFLPLIWAGLWRKPSRIVFTILSLTVAFLLFGVLQGLGAGFDSLLAAAKLDRMYTDPRFGAPLPLSYAEQIAGVPGVRIVAPRDGVFGYYQDPKNGFGVISTDERFLAVRDELHITSGSVAEWRKTRDGVLVGDGVTRRWGIKLGDTFSVHANNLTLADGSRDVSFRVVGLIADETNPGDSFFVLGNYEYVNEIRKDGKDKVSRFLLRIDDPNHTAQIARAIDALFANSAAPTRSTSDRTQAESGLGSLGDIKFFVNAIVGSVLFMLLFLTSNTMMQNFRERIPEFAVLKTLGFSDQGVTALVIGEAILQCIIGAAAGLTLGKIITTALHGKTNLPAVTLQVPWPIFAAGLGLAVIVAIVSVAVPAWRARKLDVVDALTGR